MEIDKKVFKEFCEFCEERHSIWVKRFQLKSPAPWTDDPILQKYKFCNIYRELDKGTLYYIKEMGVLGTLDSDEALLKSIIYRLVNNVAFFEYIGGIPGFDWDLDYVVSQAREYTRINGSFVGRAYMAFACTHKGKTKEDSLAEVFDWLCDNFGDWHEEVFEKSVNLHEVSEALCEIPYVGQFIAYEIICDLFTVGCLPQFNINDWVNVGPGAKPSLDKLFPGNSGDYSTLAKEVRRLHNLSKWPHKPLNLRSIEHSLCEFRKYWRIKECKIGRRFNTTTT